METLNLQQLTEQLATLQADFDSLEVITVGTIIILIILLIGVVFWILGSDNNKDSQCQGGN